MAGWITLKNTTLAAIVKGVLVHRFYSEHIATYVSNIPLSTLLTTILFALTLDYCLLFLYMTLVYPIFLSQLRHVPRPKVDI